VTAALRYLRGYPLPPGVLAELDMAGSSRSRRTALAIRQHLGPWDRVQADLAAINGAWARQAGASRVQDPGVLCPSCLAAEHTTR
jgi:hypothetical protein